MQELQQDLSNKGDELERVAGAKERADGNLRRSDSHLQQAETTIKVPSASFTALLFGPSDALCLLNLLCATYLWSQSVGSPCFSPAWPPCFSPSCQQHCVVKPTFLL